MHIQLSFAMIDSDGDSDGGVGTVGKHKTRKWMEVPRKNGGREPTIFMVRWTTTYYNTKCAFEADIFSFRISLISATAVQCPIRTVHQIIDDDDKNMSTIQKSGWN